MVDFEYFLNPPLWQEMSEVPETFTTPLHRGGPEGGLGVLTSSDQRELSQLLLCGLIATFSELDVTESTCAALGAYGRIAEREHSGFFNDGGYDLSERLYRNRRCEQFDAKHAGGTPPPSYGPRSLVAEVFRHIETCWLMLRSVAPAEDQPDFAIIGDECRYLAVRQGELWAAEDRSRTAEIMMTDDEFYTVDG